MTRWEFGAAVALDLALGDPHWFPHPVRGIGWMISRGEQAVRSSKLPLRIAGVVLCATVAAASAGLVWLTLPWGNIYWAYSFLALRSLDVESAHVIRTLRIGDIVAARKQLAMIVGRDTATLDESEIVRALIETVSENFGDGVVAPLFYLALLGPAGMAAYKAVNTLDSMVGYKDARYRELGWASAKLDDVLNYIPARLSAAFVWIAATLLGMSPARSVRTTWRDAASQPSPNSGWPEAAFAGALGVQLGGINFYRGVESRKPRIGESHRPLVLTEFSRARRLLYTAALLAIAGVTLWL
ncbi:MAG TPA: adenosylcobinamide-phosphate synthase CbiB [Bryobacteraceae bacterium]|nr:adenosylcobinamide-phosphate synthase CbiB [Bryobacteraceae bacterium]